jgi:hypothetical protein
MEINTEVLEKTGPAFSVDALMSARSKTKEAISMIAHSVKPGMLEEEARQIAKETLDRMGSQKGWHKILVRFGTNTIKNFEDPSEREMRLRDGDILFIDIGPVWGDTEGDGGETFVVGANPDPDMMRCAQDVKQIFRVVRDQWMSTGMNSTTSRSRRRRTSDGFSTWNSLGIGSRSSLTARTTMEPWRQCRSALRPTCGCSKSRFAIQPNRSAGSSRICCSLLRCSGSRWLSHLCGGPTIVPPPCQHSTVFHVSTSNTILSL